MLPVRVRRKQLLLVFAIFTSMLVIALLLDRKRISLMTKSLA